VQAISHIGLTYSKSKYDEERYQQLQQITFAADAFQVFWKNKLLIMLQQMRLYVHLFDYPATGNLVLPGYKGKIIYAQFLHDNSELKMKEEGNDILITMPIKKPGYEISVVELTLN